MENIHIDESIIALMTHQWVPTEASVVVDGNKRMTAVYLAYQQQEPHDKNGTGLFYLSSELGAAERRQVQDVLKSEPK